MKKFDSHYNPYSVLSLYTDRLVDWEKRNKKENFDFIFEHLNNWEWVSDKLPEFTEEEKREAVKDLIDFYKRLQAHFDYIERYNEELKRKEEEEISEAESYISPDIDLCSL